MPPVASDSVSNLHTQTTILILAANPKGTSPLRLGEEVRDIENGLRRAQQRDRFHIEQRWATRPRDVQEAMLDVNPQIVHFCGHGAGDEGLVLENQTGKSQPVSGPALAGLFKLFSDQVSCVLLNACHSQVQAESIAQHIPHVIGMSQEIGDRMAVEYAIAFYKALGAGRTVQFAHDLGCNAIELAGLSGSLIPTLLQQGSSDNQSADQSAKETGSQREMEPTDELRRMGKGQKDVPITGDLINTSRVAPPISDRPLPGGSAGNTAAKVFISYRRSEKESWF
ncbi:MAG: CHAT domain-containing protein [Cyanobacteria bacterium P01_F01_bin.150]